MQVFWNLYSSHSGDFMTLSWHQIKSVTLYSLNAAYNTVHISANNTTITCVLCELFFSTKFMFTFNWNNVCHVNLNFEIKSAFFLNLQNLKSHLYDYYNIYWIRPTHFGLDTELRKMITNIRNNVSATEEFVRIVNNQRSRSSMNARRLVHCWNKITALQRE